ncbi:predicted protein [Ostreococcus lucimarinus CCE9901]|uniref:Uncharacterized protein n=1 Tax=Ostreococcus lucimarinus (strain CCE9901) TaxID=436017 RepID=A4S3B7_OSTLU|nr:predicted protein [Ostreococcus lucimarinus CCE9901]ABO98359.1 predicted protein [Ostreococcus lucimarinus CCE9901]|eukprot:XP_001420066.1 predicted protein [Ostreococcus lucimarinus CCE9901]
MTSASIAQVASATAALCGAAGVTYYAVNVAKVFGGDPLPSTMTKEWEDATKARMKAWPREGSATPVVLEPMDK